jgi:6-pyruvoyltetrahydropterin 2'-reductase
MVLVSENCYFKFTIDPNFINRGIEVEIEDYKNNFKNLPIYVMSLSKNLDELQKNSEKIVQFAIKHNYIYSDRLHIRLWNRERGC